MFTPNPMSLQLTPGKILLKVVIVPTVAKVALLSEIDPRCDESLTSDLDKSS